MTSKNWDYASPGKFLPNVQTVAAFARYSFAAADAFTANDTLGATATTGTNPFIIPARSIITAAYFDAPEIDTNASPTGTVDVGILGNTAALISAGAVGAASTPPVNLSINVAPLITNGLITQGRGFYVGASDVALFVTWHASVATMATTGLITLTVHYTAGGY